MRPLNPAEPRSILVRGTNWVGDAVMSLPALAALAQICPQAQIEVLARPSVEAVYAAAPQVKKVRLLQNEGVHKGMGGRLRLAAELKGLGYDWAVILQNAFEAAFLAFGARIPMRLGYASDGRRLLLTHPVPRTAQVRRIHETSYYLSILHRAGLLHEELPPGGVRPFLSLLPDETAWAGEFMAQNGVHGPVLGLAPGAAYGPAKCWPAGRFAAAASDLAAENFGTVILFGGPGEQDACAQVAAAIKDVRVLDMAGRTSLGQALALISRLGLFLTNDSGLMHASAALGIPTVAVFGSTNPVTTGPLGPWTEVVRKPVDCSPCLKPVCPTDLRCFTAISHDEVVGAARRLLDRAGQGERA